MNIRAYKPVVQRVVRWYAKYGNDFIGEKVLDNVNLFYLKKVFRVESNNPMYECYPIQSFEHKNYLEKTFNLKINMDLYDYFIECDAM